MPLTDFLWTCGTALALSTLFVALGLYRLHVTKLALEQIAYDLHLGCDIRKALELLYKGGSATRVNLLEAQAYLIELGYETELHVKRNILELKFAKDVIIDGRKLHAEDTIELPTCPHP